MEEVTGVFNIGLHARGCACKRCQPFCIDNTTTTTMGNFPAQILYISKDTWENVGFPSTIEEYYENISKIESDSYNYEEFLRNKSA